MEHGPWEMCGPEEGDSIDTRVFICNADADQYEIIEINGDSLRARKAAARKIVALLNQTNASLST